MSQPGYYHCSEAAYYAEEAARLRRELGECRELLWEVMDSMPHKKNKKSDPCPVCWTYSHKSWCWYEQVRRLVDPEG
jgi:hypothetical protein